MHWRVESHALSWAGVMKADNRIGDAGCESLCSALRVNSTLTSLGVRGECDMYLRGACRLLKL